MTIGNPPCNGCTRCCHNDAVRLLPDDDVTRYATVPHFLFPRQRQLAQKSNGDCVYLGAHGCTIHDRKPQMCREMDCRLIAQALSYTQARKAAKAKRLALPVWRKGKELLREAP